MPVEHLLSFLHLYVHMKLFEDPQMDFHEFLQYLSTHPNFG
jgi:hypothetical protein